jgi:hypothetical protein
MRIKKNLASVVYSLYSHSGSSTLFKVSSRPEKKMLEIALEKVCQHSECVEVFQNSGTFKGVLVLEM